MHQITKTLCAFSVGLALNGAAFAQAQSSTSPAPKVEQGKNVVHNAPKAAAPSENALPGHEKSQPSAAKPSPAPANPAAPVAPEVKAKDKKSAVESKAHSSADAVAPVATPAPANKPFKAVTKSATSEPVKATK
jgi:hypothetical protein